MFTMFYKNYSGIIFWIGISAIIIDTIFFILDAFEVSLDLYQDVGIAGLHRLLGAVEKIIENDTSVIIAVAGQEGGLAPVLTGLVDIPVIGVPTSTGSGFGGEGVAALSTMLQSCSLGLSVVNIDNGVAASMVALTMLKQMN